MTPFLLADITATQRFGELLGSLLRSGDVLALMGEMGVGKTTLTQAIAQGMGITEYVTSPTFSLVLEYSGTLPLYHFDTYRLEDPNEAYYLGLDEYVARPGVIVIEWADRIAHLLPVERLEIQMEIVEDSLETRRVTVHAIGLRPMEIEKALKEGYAA